MTERQELAQIVIAAEYAAANECMASECSLCFGTAGVDSEQCTAEMKAEYLIDHGVVIRKEAAWLIDGVWAECSNCHEAEKIEEMNHKDYCPACGARMVVK